MINGRKIITLCGSTKFKREFEEINKKLTLEGNIVISVGVFVHNDEEKEALLSKKDLLDEIHLDKIRLADEIFVINKNGYIGESTRREIEFAKKLGKPIRYLEPDKAPL